MDKIFNIMTKVYDKKNASGSADCGTFLFFLKKMPLGVPSWAETSRKMVLFFPRSGSSELGRTLQKNGPFFSRSGSSELGEDLQKNCFFAYIS